MLSKTSSTTEDNIVQEPAQRKSRRFIPRAEQNTAHVLAAIRAYHRRARSRKPGTAKRAAIDRYRSLSGRSVSEKTVRRWLIIVERYGGLPKVPTNAFWGKKSHPVPRPVLDRLYDIDEVAGKLFFAREQSPSSFAKRLLAIDQALRNCVARVKEGSPRYFVRSIRKSARLLAQALRCSHEPNQFISEPQLYAALTDVLVGLRKVARKRTERVI